MKDSVERILYGKLTVKVCADSVKENLWEEAPRHPKTLEFLHRKLLQMDEPVMLDIGAGQGRYALLAKFVPGMRVFCWEPNPTVYGYLTANVRLNDLEDRILTFQCGLWHRPGQKVLRIHPYIRRSRSATMGDHPHKASWGEVAVEVKKLDDFQSHWEKVDLVKLDVEGAEWFVLRGGRRTIKRWKPPLFLEWMECTVKMFGYTRKEMKETLQSWGYKKFTPFPPYDIWVTT